MPVIRIRGHKFELGRQWQAGHVLTPGEASALTQVFCENVRNNVDQWVVGALDSQPWGGELEAAVHAELQRRIIGYAREYQFRAGAAGSPSLTPLERHARAVAEERIRARHQLMFNEELPGSIDEADLAVVSMDPEVRRLAGERLAAERAVAQAALEQLL